MQWKVEYSVGIPEVDTDHRQLIDCVTKIEEAVAKGEGGSMVHYAIEQLISSSSTHFDIEESLMETQRYPEIDDHVMGHGEFLERLELMKGKSLAGPLADEAVQFLGIWLEEHFIVDDEHYGWYLSHKA